MSSTPRRSSDDPIRQQVERLVADTVLRRLNGNGRRQSPPDEAAGPATREAS